MVLKNVILHLFFFLFGWVFRVVSSGLYCAPCFDCFVTQHHFTQTHLSSAGNMQWNIIVLQWLLSYFSGFVPKISAIIVSGSKMLLSLAVHTHTHT